IWLWLDSIGKLHAIMRSITQQVLELRQVPWRRYNQYISDASKHKYAEWIVDHRLVIDRHHLLGDSNCQGEQTSSRSTCKNNSFHSEPIKARETVSPTGSLPAPPP